jgi:hypothetical protein
MKKKRSLISLPVSVNSFAVPRRRPELVLQRPLFFGILAAGVVALQVVVSYWSYRFLMADDFILAFLFFLFVPVLALLLVLFYLRFQKGHAH